MRDVNWLGVSLMVAALVLTGCESKKAISTTPVRPTTNTAETPTKEKDTHTHGKGPNGGVVFDLGKYHAEFTVDHDRKQCTVLLLGEDEKTPAAVATKELTLTTRETKTKDGKVVPPMTIKMTPTDAKDGKATKFVGTDPGLGNVADFEGTVIGEIDSKPSQGEFKE